MCLFDPFLGDQQGDIAALDVDRSVKDPFRSIARDRHAHLLADMAVAGVERGRLGDDRLVEHQQHGPVAALQSGFQPPFD